MTMLRDGLLASAGLALLVGAACSDYREGREHASSPTAQRTLSYATDETIRRFRAQDPSMSRFFDRAVGYAVFPVVTRGGLVVGAAHGDDGVLYERGRPIGEVELTQITVGAQIGGQDFSQIIFFQHDGALGDFKDNNTEFAANASAVAASAGAGATSDFSNGVAVFTMPLGGLMAEASIGGQTFRYTPFLTRKTDGSASANP